MNKSEAEEESLRKLSGSKFPWRQEGNQEMGLSYVLDDERGKKKTNDLK